MRRATMRLAGLLLLVQASGVRSEVAPANDPAYMPSLSPSAVPSLSPISNSSLECDASCLSEENDAALRDAAAGKAVLAHERWTFMLQRHLTAASFEEHPALFAKVFSNLCAVDSELGVLHLARAACEAATAAYGRARVDVPRHVRSKLDELVNSTSCRYESNSETKFDFSMDPEKRLPRVESPDQADWSKPFVVDAGERADPVRELENQLRDRRVSNQPSASAWMSVFQAIQTVDPGIQAEIYCQETKRRTSNPFFVPAYLAQEDMDQAMGLTSVGRGEETCPVYVHVVDHSKALEVASDLLPTEEWRRVLVASQAAWIARCFPEPEDAERFLKETHWAFALLGTRYAGMFNHQDTLRTASWQIVVAGTKMIHLCPPEEGEVGQAGPPGVLDAPDVGKGCQRDVLAPGEIVYYPRDYFHETSNIGEDVNAAFTSTMVHEHQKPDFVRGLMLECDGSKGERSLLSRSTCDLLRDRFDCVYSPSEP